MKVTALQDFNLGSMAADHKEGEVIEVTASVGKELVDLGLAEEADEATEVTKAPKPGSDRKKKPATGPTETK